MKLLNMRKTGNDVYSDVITLDELWEKAASLGKIQVNGGFSAPEVVEIVFNLKPSGSRVWAKGHHTDIREAFRLAIEEAITLGAKP